MVLYMGIRCCIGIYSVIKIIYNKYITVHNNNHIWSTYPERQPSWNSSAFATELSQSNQSNHEFFRVQRNNFRRRYCNSFLGKYSITFLTLLRAYWYRANSRNWRANIFPHTEAILISSPSPMRSILSRTPIIIRPGGLLSLYQDRVFTRFADNVW